MILCFLPFLGCANRLQNFTFGPGESRIFSLESEDIVFLREEGRCPVPFKFIPNQEIRKSFDICKLGGLLFRGESLEIKSTSDRPEQIWLWFVSKNLCHVNNYLISPLFSYELSYPRFFNFCFFSPPAFGPSSCRVRTNYRQQTVIAVDSHSGRNVSLREEVLKLPGPFLIAGYGQGTVAEGGRFSFEINMYPQGSCRVEAIESLTDDSEFSVEKVDIVKSAKNICRDLELRGFPLTACLIFIVAWMSIIGHLLHRFHWMNPKQLLGLNNGSSPPEQPPARAEERLEIVETDLNDNAAIDFGIRETRTDPIVIAA
jgi:hypothetical protein